jgi:Raf kinase inhibitor-like YbhB/YbcL family protein
MLQRPRAEDPYAKLPPLPSFGLTSSDVEHGSPMPIEFAATDAGQGARNLSPQLAWKDFPHETQSFVVSCFDPDAPTPSGFWHWVLVDIPASVTSLETGASPPDGAIAMKSDWGTPGYAGPLPPEGDFAHRYYFVVHAVREPSLGVDPDVAPVVVAFNLVFKASARAQIVPTFQR